MWKEKIEEYLLEIEKIHKLPTNGILAGGALANVIWNSLTGNKAPINDIDIFLIEMRINNIRGYKSSYGIYKSIYKRHREPEYEGNDYDNIEYHDGNSYYKLKKSVTDGIINILTVESNCYDPLLIIKGFDLNCVQVSYDLRTKTLYYTKEFEEFLNTGVIKYLNSNSIKTFFRILKKSDELNAVYEKYLLDELFYKYCSKFALNDKYVSIYQKYKHITSEYFILEDRTIKPKFILEVNHLYNSNISKFYFKMIHKTEYEKCWNSIGLICSTNLMMYDKLSKDNILIEKIEYVINKTNNNINLFLKGLSIEEQITFIRRSFNMLKRYANFTIFFKQTNNYNRICIDYVKFAKYDEYEMFLCYLKAVKKIKPRRADKKISIWDTLNDRYQYYIRTNRQIDNEI